MALITCTECGKEFSDKAPACPNCGCPTNEVIQKDSLLPKEESISEEKKGFWSTMIQKQNEANAVGLGKCCPKCKGNNISIQFVETAHKHKGRNEVRKKSAVTRAGNKAGRAAMIGMTGGLWALTPKKSDYSEVKKGKSDIKSQKVAICQDCGRSWNIF